MVRVEVHSKKFDFQKSSSQSDNPEALEDRWFSKVFEWQNEQLVNVRIWFWLNETLSCQPTQCASKRQ